MVKQIYDIHASFLIPTYNLPDGMLSHYVTTQEGVKGPNKIGIDVWLVSASKEHPRQTMIQSLQKEVDRYQAELDRAVAEEKPENDSQKSDRICQLEYGKTVFSQLVTMANNSIFDKGKPDDEFLQIANNNFSQPYFAKFKPDLTNHLYLAALSHYREER